MSIKKRIGTILSIALSMSIMSSMPSLNVYAHNSDYLSGTYASTASFNQSNLKFQINSSAQTTLLTSSVYNSAFSWDGISSKVGNLSIAVITESMPSMGFYPVNGQFYSDGTLAEVIPYNSSGSIISAGGDWHRVVIQMNTSTST